MADVVTVLRDGKKVATRPAAGLEPVDMARLMVGRDLLALYPPRVARPVRRPVPRRRGFRAPTALPRTPSFSVRPGEIFRLLRPRRRRADRAVRGPVRLAQGGGRDWLDGKPQQWRDARAGHARRRRLSDRGPQGQGLLLEETLATTLTLAALDGFQRGPVARPRWGSPGARHGDPALRHPGRRQGAQRRPDVGRQRQELLLAKMMLLDPRVVVIDEPTRGIDIGAKQQIYRFIAAMAGRGAVGDRDFVGDGGTDRRLPPHHRRCATAGSPARSRARR